MYLKYSFMIMTISIGFLFWFIWGELQRLKVQLAIQKSEMELFRKEIINLINKADELTNIADGVDKSVEEDTLSIINQLNNLLGYSVKDGEK